jgi:PIN domain nuclease of toxin-antitoxin system
VAESILLDTCAALWLIGGAPMPKASRLAIREARLDNLGVYVSPITAWEIGTLANKGQIHLALSADAWFDELLALPGVRLAPLTSKILLASTSLPGHPPRDPADRVIAATARLHGQMIVTRDRKLLDYAREGHIRARAC